MASHQTPDMNSDPSRPIQLVPAGHVPPGYTSMGHSPTGHTSKSQSPTGHTSMGYAPTGHTSKGHAHSGHAPTGHAPSGHAPTGHAPTGHASMGHDYTSHTPTGNAPMGRASTGHTYTKALPPDLIRPYFPGGRAFTLGVIQCVMGMTLFIQQVMFLHLFVNAFQHTAAGIWTGILVMVTGVFGCLAGRTRKDYMISTWKMLCVMSVVACVLTFATSIIGATSLDPAVKVIGDTRSGTAAKLNLKPSGRVMLGSTMAVFSAITGIITLASSIMTCCSAGLTTFQETQGGNATPTFNSQPYPPNPERPYTHQPPYQPPNPQPYGPDHSPRGA